MLLVLTIKISSAFYKINLKIRIQGAYLLMVRNVCKHSGLINKPQKKVIMTSKKQGWIMGIFKWFLRLIAPSPRIKTSIKVSRDGITIVNQG